VLSKPSFREVANNPSEIARTLISNINFFISFSPFGVIEESIDGYGYNGGGKGCVSRNPR